MRSAFRAGLIAAALLAAGAAGAGEVSPATVELSPFGGIQHGGGQGGACFGATLDAALTAEWSVELMYSRQPVPGSLEPDSLTAVERYLGAAQQVTGQPEDATRFFGLALVGATRYATASAGSAARFTLGLGLGVKHAFSRRLGLRVEARGYWVSGAGSALVACNGGCVGAFSAVGGFDGDLTGGLTLRF